MQVGLICGAGGYLTAGRYGDGVTALGSSLGKKQTWKLKVTTKQGEQTVVELIGHQGQPLLVDADGTVRCAPPVSEQQRQFLLEVHPSGAWTLQHMHSRKYLESDGEDVFCITRGLASYHRWMPQLAMHVHVVLFNPSAQLYARADPELNRVWVDTPVPYLEECSFILRFRSGVYHLETSNHREGRILYPHGSRGLLCLGDNPADNEEWFVIQRCPQWVSLRTRTKRYMTIICDSEVYAGSKKVTPMSVFHLEVNSGAKTVQLKGINHSYLAQACERGLEVPAETAPTS